MGPLVYFLLIKFYIYLFLFIPWLHWVFVAVHRLSLAAESGGYYLVAVCGFQQLLSLGSTGFSCSLWAPESRLSCCGTWA